MQKTVVAHSVKIGFHEKNMVNKSVKTYSLQITISTLFIAISLTLGIVLSWQSYNKASDIMLAAADDLYERISHELALDIKATYGPIAGGLRLFRLSPRKISTPLTILAKQTKAISRFDFDATPKPSSFIKEVSELANATVLMKSTISKGHLY